MNNFCWNRDRHERGYNDLLMTSSDIYLDNVSTGQEITAGKGFGKAGCKGYNLMTRFNTGTINGYGKGATITGTGVGLGVGSGHGVGRGIGIGEKPVEG